METVNIKDLDRYEGQDVELKGWVYNIRTIGKIWFVIFRDGTGLLQGVVVKGEATDETFSLEQKLHQEDSVIINGTVRKEPRSVGGYELGVKEIKVVNHVTEEYPISPKDHGADFLMSNRHLWLRSKRQHAILKVRHQIIKAIRDFFDSNDFTLVDSPIFTPNAAEGTSTLFETNYFDKMAYLAQTGQLYGEASAMAFGRHYNFGPCFRAEKSKTRRHLTEFWMVEPEMAYCDIEEDIQWAEDLLVYIVEQVIENKMDQLEILERDIESLNKIKGPFPRVSYTECVEMLQADGFDIKWGDDFGSPHETFIAEKFKQPVIVHRFPTEIKAFYMKRDPENEKVVLGMDILAPEGYGEIVGGSERETRINVLEERIAEEGLNQEDFDWFLDLRRYGSVPHSGFGMGIERVVAWICKLPHVRETIPFPRMMGRLKQLTQLEVKHEYLVRFKK